MLNKYFLYFMIYSFFGWFFERLFIFILTGKFINGGFLLGPFSTLYGVGVVLVIFIYKLFKKINFKNITYFYILIFLVIVTATTVLEYLTGIAIEELFGRILWNYKNVFGPKSSKYISIPVSLCWGVLSIVLVEFIHPFIRKIATYIPKWLSYVLLAYILTDITISVLIFSLK